MKSDTPVDRKFRDAVHTGTIAASIDNLQDLLSAIDGTAPCPNSPTAMLHTVARHISGFLNKEIQQIGIDELNNLRSAFRLYLKDRRYAPGTIQCYCYYARMLVQMAQDLGWVSHRPDVAENWEKIRQCISKNSGAAQIVNYAIATGKAPEHFSDKELADWCKLTAAQGRTTRRVLRTAGQFRNRIFRAELNGLIPNLSPPRKEYYGVRLDEIPNPLRTDITNLIAWKTAEISPGRKPNCMHRPATPLRLRQFLSRYYGYVAKIEGQQVSDLKALCNEDSMFSYVNWCTNERGLRKCSLSSHLGALHGIVTTYPRFKGVDFGWLKGLVAELRNNREEAMLGREAKREKWVDYDTLAELPKEMRRDAEKKYKIGTVQYSSAMRDVLLITWLLTLPWPQKNLRECRSGRREDGANVFKAGVLDLPAMALPEWLVEQARLNPNLEVWLFCFRPRETTTGHFIHGILPLQIAVPLETYMNSLRPHLISGSDPGTLFVNDKGRPFDAGLLRDHVTNATYRYFGRLVNPQMFRDIFAVKYLEERPNNYLLLSKILWHRDVNTTMRLERLNFDESHGARASGEWLEERARRKKR